MKLFLGDGVDVVDNSTAASTEASGAPGTTPTKAPRTRKPRPKKAAAKKAAKRTKAASPRQGKRKTAAKVSKPRSYTPHAEAERSGFGLRVYRARLKKGITQTKLGRACRCHQSRISDIEAGRREPTERQKMGIKRAVGV